MSGPASSDFYSFTDYINKSFLSLKSFFLLGMIHRTTLLIFNCLLLQDTKRPSYFRASTIVKMQFTLVLATFAAVVYGQTINGVPACAIPCIESAISSQTSCASTDFACACPSISAVSAAGAPCVVAACGEDVATSEFTNSQFASEVDRSVLKGKYADMFCCRPSVPSCPGFLRRSVDALFALGNRMIRYDLQFLYMDDISK